MNQFRFRRRKSPACPTAVRDFEIATSRRRAPGMPGSAPAVTHAPGVLARAQLRPGRRRALVILVMEAQSVSGTGDPGDGGAKRQRALVILVMEAQSVSGHW